MHKGRFICRSIIGIVAIGSLAACEEAPLKVQRTAAQIAQEIASVFEAKDEYSGKHLDSTFVFSYLAEHPETRQDSAAIVGFYQRRCYQFAWFVNDSLAAATSNLVNLMSASDTLLCAEPNDDDAGCALVGALLRGDTITLSAAQRRSAELALTAHFFRFADKSYGGIVQRDVRELDWFIPRRKKNVDQLLDSIAAGHMDLSAYEPVHPQYQALKKELVRYHYVEKGHDWSPIVLSSDSGMIVQVSERLSLLGDLGTEDSTGVPDSTFIAGLQRFQMRHGLKASGTIDEATLAELNKPLDARIRQIMVNMERLRWVDPEPPKNMILVNIPEYRLHVIENDTERWDMSVVVGAQATRTVIFSGDLSTIVLAPYWNVPQSIIRNEILPAVKKNSSYLAKKEMEVVKGGKVVPASSIDWKKYSSGVPFVIRQRPGDQNALGKVKFLFPNEYSIYLHDTPSKSKFLEEKRAFSHGCIRLSAPVKLAEYLLRNDTTWTPETIEEAMKGKKEITVRLAEPMPVVIGYFTAWVDASGRLNFRDDVYGNDARLANELFAPTEIAQSEEEVQHVQ